MPGGAQPIREMKNDGYKLEKLSLRRQNSNGNDGNGKGPVVIEVQGLQMDHSSPRYEIVKDMEETENTEETLDPLTEAKNSKNKDDADSEEEDKHKSDLKEDENKDDADSEEEDKHKSDLKEDENKGATNSDTIKKDKNLRNSLIKAENSTGAANDNEVEEIENNNLKKNDEEEKKKDEVNKVSGKTDGKKTEEDVIVLVAGKDDVDAASTYSLFMEKDFRYYFQHPYCRLTIAYFVVFCNFFIYAEDPVAHSRKECLIPMIGNDFAFVCNRYPANAWSLLKVVFWLTGLIIGLFVGKLLVHGLLFNRLFRLKMFSDSQGSWMIMFLISLITIFIMSLFYNLFLMIGGESTEPYRISDLMGVRNDIFMKAAACGTWCGDFFTAWMVTDIMLQEKLYPGWARPVRNWWKRGWNRIILFWIVVVVTSFVVIFVIATDYIQWDKLNRDFMPTNEVSRAFLASFILVMDLLIVMQDWDFPHFMSAIDIKLPGLNTAHIQFSIPKFLKREKWQVHITGKWFNYGILFLVMLLDLNMWKNQMFYSPYDYGQYTNPDGRIYTVQDDFSLEEFNETQITFAFRNSTINPATGNAYIEGDTHMNTQYLAYAIGIKGIAFVPSIASFIVFGVLIWNFGRFRPTEHDPYAGRLKKRFRKRFSLKNLSFKLPWRRREDVRRKVHAVPKLLYFKRKGKKGETDQIEQKEIPAEGFIDDTEAKIEVKAEAKIEENIETKIEEKN